MGRNALVICVAVGLVAATFSASAGADAGTPAADSRAAKPAERRVFLLGLRQRGRPGQFASRVSNPSAPQYRRFLSLRRYRKRFSPSRADRRRVRRYLASRAGVRRSS